MSVIDVTDEALVQWGRDAIGLEAAALKVSSDRLNAGFAAAVRAVLDAKGKVVTTGLGKSGHVARKVASTLASTGTTACYLHPSEALHGDFGVIQPADVVLAIAYGGETAEVLEVCRFARRIHAPIVAITGKKESSLGRLADHFLDGFVSCEADALNLAPTCSSTVAIALGDALAVALSRGRGFTHLDFAGLHPGGSLGRRLSLVRDHMHGGAELPKVADSANFHDILEAVTAHNFGITAVVNGRGELVGAVSDGDLRRALLARGAGALHCTAGELMSAKPSTVSDHVLAIDAVALMSERPKPITSLFVVDDGGRPVGLLRLHDLIVAKIL